MPDETRMSSIPSFLARAPLLSPKMELFLWIKKKREKKITERKPHTKQRVTLKCKLKGLC